MSSSGITFVSLYLFFGTMVAEFMIGDLANYLHTHSSFIITFVFIATIILWLPAGIIIISVEFITDCFYFFLAKAKKRAEIDKDGFEKEDFE